MGIFNNMRVSKHMTKISQDKIDSIYSMTMEWHSIISISKTLWIAESTVSRRKKLMHIDYFRITSNFS